jgi:hypothetical protein
MDMLAHRTAHRKVVAAHVPEHVHSTGWIDSSSSPYIYHPIHLQQYLQYFRL